MPLNEILNRRRSQRSFSGKGLTLEKISALLRAAKGVTELPQDVCPLCLIPVGYPAGWRQ